VSTSATIGLITTASGEEQVRWLYCHTDGGSREAELEWLLTTAARSGQVAAAVAKARGVVGVEAPWPTPFAFMIDARADGIVEMSSLRLEDGEHAGGWWAREPVTSCWHVVAVRRWFLPGPPAAG
jgi:hypothetical protein